MTNAALELKRNKYCSRNHPTTSHEIITVVGFLCPHVRSTAAAQCHFSFHHIVPWRGDFVVQDTATPVDRDQARTVQHRDYSCNCTPIAYEIHAMTNRWYFDSRLSDMT